MKHHPAHIIHSHRFAITFRLVTCLLLTATLLGGCASGAKPPVPTEEFPIVEGTQALPDQAVVEGASKDITQYAMNIMLDTAHNTLEVSQTVEYIHKGAGPTSNLFFHLYPNAFATEQSAPFSDFEWNMAYPNGFSPGSLTIDTVQLGEAEADWSYADAGKQILSVTLSETLEIGGSATLNMQYRVQIPNNLGRFGYGEWSYNLCNFYPIACVMDQDGYKLDPYYHIGDPFYSDIANYSVTLHVPQALTVASSGSITEESASGGAKTYTIQGNAIRDFAFIASEYFALRSVTVGDTCVTSYYLDPDKLPGHPDIISHDAGVEALRSGAFAIGRYNELFGEYPYGNFNIVQTDFYIGGMEYPGMVLIDKSLYHTNQRESLYTVVIHETAHQWWYAMVGNNEVKEPVIDEALADYSTHILMEEFYTKYDPRTPLENFRRYESLKFIGDDQSLTRGITGYKDMFEYDALVYKKGSLMYIALSDKVGADKLHNALKKFFEKYRFGIATLSDLKAVIEKELGPEAMRLMNAFLDGTVRILDRDEAAAA